MAKKKQSPKQQMSQKKAIKRIYENWIRWTVVLVTSKAKWDS